MRLTISSKCRSFLRDAGDMVGQVCIYKNKIYNKINLWVCRSELIANVKVNIQILTRLHNILNKISTQIR